MQLFGGMIDDRSGFNNIGGSILTVFQVDLYFALLLQVLENIKWTMLNSYPVAI